MNPLNRVRRFLVRLVNWILRRKRSPYLVVRQQYVAGDDLPAGSVIYLRSDGTVITSKTSTHDIPIGVVTGIGEDGKTIISVSGSFQMGDEK